MMGTTVYVGINSAKAGYNNILQTGLFDDFDSVLENSIRRLVGIFQKRNKR